MRKFPKLLAILASSTIVAFLISLTANIMGIVSNNFPSHHTMYAFVIAISAISFSKRLGIFCIILAIGISIWRIFGGYHSISEVLGGVAIGIASVLISKTILHFVLKEKE